jgi:1-acyl-sn-glycerol-3-phosphate acyltransferase
MNPFAALGGVVKMGHNAISDWAEIAQLRIPAGDDLDAWDPDYIRATLPLLRDLFQVYFRPEVTGLDRIPDGPSLLVGNHSGGTMIADTFVFATEFYAHFGCDRRFHQLAHDVAVRVPGTGIRRYGTLAANHDNARAAFERGAPVLVYPGGDYETFRPTWQQDRIQFAGRKGWVRLALEQGVPIVPVVSIGGQETALFITRGEQLAELTGLSRLARIKVLPIALGPPFGVTLLDLPGRVPLPAKIQLEVMEPIDLVERFGPGADPDEVYAEVTDEMQGKLNEMAEERTLPLVG